MYPENDELCASIISQVLGKTNNYDSRDASSSVDITMNRDRNQVYALRQKMFLPHIPNTRWTQSRTASIGSENTEPVKNKVFQLRRVMFGHYSK